MSNCLQTIKKYMSVPAPSKSETDYIGTTVLATGDTYD